MVERDSAGVTGIIWRKVDPAKEAEAEETMRELMMLSRNSPGYLGSEIFSPVPGIQEAYVVLYRFNSSENLRHWLSSARRAELLQKIAPFLLEPAFEFFFAHRRRAAGTASSVFSYRVRPGFEEKFAGWRGRILDEVRTWKGFLGTESFDTLDSARPELVVVVRFNNRENLDAWLRSPEREAFMAEVGHYVEHHRLRRIGSGFEGWFDFSDEARPPARWRQGLVILAALFPLITIMRHVMAPVFEGLPVALAFLILLAVDVALLSYLIMPHFSRLMNFWLRPKPGRPWWQEGAGWVILLGMLATTLAAALALKG